jgi:hypothetical protein
MRLPADDSRERNIWLRSRSISVVHALTSHAPSAHAAPRSGRVTKVWPTGSPTSPTHGRQGHATSRGATSHMLVANTLLYIAHNIRADTITASVRVQLFF